MLSTSQGSYALASFLKENSFVFENSVHPVSQPPFDCLLHFSAACHGTYTAEVPLFLNNDTSVYRVVTLSGYVKSPKINFDPQILILTPVPLNIKTGTDVHIIPQDYFR